MKKTWKNCLPLCGRIAYNVRDMKIKSLDNPEYLEWYLNESPELAEARAEGIDVWALWANLQRSVGERLRRHDIAIETLRKLREAKKL